MKSALYYLIALLKPMLIIILSFLAPIQTYCMIMFFLIMVDFIFAIIKAYKLGEKIESKKMGNTIGKILLYCLAVLVVFVMDTFIVHSGVNPTKIVAVSVCMVEFKSILETFESITGIDVYSKIKGIMTRGETNTKTPKKK